MFSQIEFPIAPSWRYTFAVVIVLIAGLALQHDIIPTPFFWLLSLPQCLVAAAYIHRYTLLSSNKSVSKLVVNSESKTLAVIFNNGEKANISDVNASWISGRLVFLTLRIAKSSEGRQTTIPLLLNLKSSPQNPSPRRLRVLLKHNYFKD